MGLRTITNIGTDYNFFSTPALLEEGGKGHIRPTYHLRHMEGGLDTLYDIPNGYVLAKM